MTVLSEFYRIYLPCSLFRRKDGAYLPLNSKHKPLGQLTNDWVDYETHPGAVRLSMTPDLARKLSFDGSGKLGWIALYDGTCLPGLEEHYPAYAARLALLMQAGMCF